jgi:DNA-binding transcriptional regulator LsrR (DeoR family)
MKLDYMGFVEMFLYRCDVEEIYPLLELIHKNEHITQEEIAKELNIPLEKVKEYLEEDMKGFIVENEQNKE